MNNRLLETLTRLGACDGAKDWVRDNNITTIAEAWEKCPRGDWLIWWAHKRGVETKLLVLSACGCARTALKYVPSGEDRPRVAIETAERWCRGEATIEETGAAAQAAWAAAEAAAWAASWAAARAAWAAARAAWAASWAARDASWAAAEKRAHARCARIVREVIPERLVGAKKEAR